MSTGGHDHQHHFDPISGWCAYCNLRKDGRLIGKGGDIYRPGPEYTDQQIASMRQGAMA